MKNDESITHQEILEAIDFFPLHGLNAWLQPALRAVVELHKPTDDLSTVNTFCLQCRDEDYPALYPCLTIQAIEKQLI